eukprot:2295403-Rhodomonas_salina.1
MRCPSLIHAMRLQAPFSGCIFARSRGAFRCGSAPEVAFLLSASALSLRCPGLTQRIRRDAGRRRASLFSRTIDAPPELVSHTFFHAHGMRTSGTETARDATTRSQSLQRNHRRRSRSRCSTNCTPTSSNRSTNQCPAAQ